MSWATIFETLSRIELSDCCGQQTKQSELHYISRAENKIVNPQRQYINTTWSQFCWWIKKIVTLYYLTISFMLLFDACKECGSTAPVPKHPAQQSNAHALFINLQPTTILLIWNCARERGQPWIDWPRQLWGPKIEPRYLYSLAITSAYLFWKIDSAPCK